MKKKTNDNSMAADRTLSAAELKWKSLEQLLDLLPMCINWKDEEIQFALTKINNGFMCYAWETSEGYPAFMDDADMEELEFHAKTAHHAVYQMLLWLRRNKLADFSCR